MNREYDLIVTIIDRGRADRMVKASKAAGAEGGTILHGRGVGIHDVKTLLGITIEPEKDVLLTIITSDKTQKVLDAIVAAGKLDEPGAGISFAVALKKVAGIVHHKNSDN